MTKLLKRGLVLTAVVAAAAAFGTAGGAGAVSIRVVDDDYAQCPGAGYTAIGDAIADANDGDTILVCPGDYTGEGNIVVDKRLSLVGYTGKLVSMAACADEVGHAMTETSKNSIVQSFQFAANFVSIRGFTIDHASAQGVLIPAGVNRATVRSNVIQFAPIGVNLNGSSSMVYTNCIRDNNTAGSASGTGIYSDQGLTASTINQNLFWNNTSAAITLLDTAGAGSLDNNTVSDNSSLKDGDLLSTEGLTNSKITGNSSSQSVGAAIYLQPGAGGAPNSGLEISKNKLTDGTTDIGINVDNDALVNSTIKSNTSKGNAYGIVIQGPSTNMGNSITKNDFRGNVNYDCVDQTNGSTGTNGTDNTWKKNKGKTSYPAGICK